jgi:hypothetical protein
MAMRRFIKNRSIFPVARREGGADKGGEQRMGIHGSGFEFGMELTPDKVRVVWNFYHLHQAFVWADARQNHAALGEGFAVLVVHFVAVAMSL